MCGIIGYIGLCEKKSLILNALKELEYRGYDSAGLAVLEGDGVCGGNLAEAAGAKGGAGDFGEADVGVGEGEGGNLYFFKAAGKLEKLAQKCDTFTSTGPGLAIGHTRWATHGKPTEINAHPHLGRYSCLIHNGIIENYKELKEALAAGEDPAAKAPQGGVAQKNIEDIFLKKEGPAGGSGERPPVSVCPGVAEVAEKQAPQGGGADCQPSAREWGGEKGPPQEAGGAGGTQSLPADLSPSSFFSKNEGQANAEPIHFVSQTDTEVIVALFEFYARSLGADQAWARTVGLLRGAFALLLISKKSPGRIYFAKHSAPLIIGRRRVDPQKASQEAGVAGIAEKQAPQGGGSGEKGPPQEAGGAGGAKPLPADSSSQKFFSNAGEFEYFFASAEVALIGLCDEIFYLEDGSWGWAEEGGVRIFCGEEEVRPAFTRLTGDRASAQKDGFDFFMQKEIYEQSRVLSEVLMGRISGDEVVFEELGDFFEGFVGEAAPQEEAISQKTSPAGSGVAPAQAPQEAGVAAKQAPQAGGVPGDPATPQKTSPAGSGVAGGSGGRPPDENGAKPLPASSCLSSSFFSKNEDQPTAELTLCACGTSYHAALVGAYLFERLARVRARVEIASEFRCRSPLILPGSIFIAISQSGETADTLEALKIAAAAGARTLAICNVENSSMTRLAQASLLTRAGIEKGVASTKAFATQVLSLWLLAVHLAQRQGLDMSEELSALLHSPSCVAVGPGLHERIHRISKRYLDGHGFFYIGRDVFYPLALEGALKLKELSYLHAEGYPAGEMKHGPIALADAKLYCVALLPSTLLYEKTRSNIEELIARDATVLGISPLDFDQADDLIRTGGQGHFMCEFFEMMLIIQLLALEISLRLGRDVDMPRNLAKSVTVE